MDAETASCDRELITLAWLPITRCSFCIHLMLLGNQQNKKIYQALMEFCNLRSSQNRLKTKWPIPSEPVVVMVRRQGVERRGARGQEGGGG